MQTRLPSTAAEPALRDDIKACHAALRNGSKTFLAASMLLPRGVHEPASALYAFCRLADDAVDAHDGEHAAVERLRERLTLAYAGTPQPHAADRALALVVARHGIPRALFDALLEGFEWDLHGRRYDTLAALHDYAARVAGTVGAMMALLMGVRSAEGLARACDLGVAMQLSNIARDVGEDARMGRLYLPRDCRPGINAARFLYAEIGREVARRGGDSVARRAYVPAMRKAWLLLRAVAQLVPSQAAQHVPPLEANRFLVDAALASRPAAEPPRHSLSDRVVWTAELFVRLDRA